MRVIQVPGAVIPGDLPPRYVEALDDPIVDHFRDVFEDPYVFTNAYPFTIAEPGARVGGASRNPHDARKLLSLPELGRQVLLLFIPNIVFARLLLAHCVPALNALIPLFYAGQLPDSSSLAIVSHFAFVGIILEVLREAVVNSLFHLVGRDYRADHERAMQALKLCLLILFLLGTLLSVLVIAFAGQLVNAINTTEAIAETTKTYLFTSAFSFPIILMNEAIKCHLLLTKNILMVVSLLFQMLFVFLLNFFLFGRQPYGAHWGVDELGYYKVIEALTAFTTSAVFFFIVEKMTPVTFLYRIPWFSDLTSLLKTVFKVGWGNFGDSWIRNFFYFSVTLNFVNEISANEAAAWNLLNTIVWTFLMIPSYALTDHVKVEVGLHARSTFLKTKMTEVAKETARGLCAWMLVVMIVSVTCWSSMAQLFSPHNVAVQELSRQMFFSVGWAFIAHAVSSAIGGVFVGTGHTRFAFYQTLIANLAVNWGPWVAFLAGVLQPTTWLVTTLYSMAHFTGMLLSVGLVLHLWGIIY